jgi:hypothetical protein
MECVDGAQTAPVDIPIPHSGYKMQRINEGLSHGLQGKLEENGLLL